MSTTATTATVDKKATALVPAVSVSAYSKITDVAAFVQGFGNAIYKSGIFGAACPEQGQVMAMECLAQKISPLQLLATYHFIGGKMSMKTDEMLARLNRMGGRHRLIARTPDKAAVELQAPNSKEKHLFEFTWEDAKVEDYIFNKSANKNEIPKRLPSGEINPAALKDNWSTPRRRMQMLWARVVSDGVRAICPQVNGGMYSPDENGVEYVEDEQAVGDTVVEAEFTVVAEPPPAAEKQHQSDAKTKPENEAAADIPFVAEESPGIDDRTYWLIGIKKAKEMLEIGQESWAKILDKRGVKSAKDLPNDQLESLYSALKGKVEQAGKIAELQSWVESQIGKK